MMIIDDRHNIGTIIKVGLIEIDSHCCAPDFFWSKQHTLQNSLFITASVKHDYSILSKL